MTLPRTPSRCKYLPMEGCRRTGAPDWGEALKNIPSSEGGAGEAGEAAKGGGKERRNHTQIFAEGEQIPQVAELF